MSARGIVLTMLAIGALAAGCRSGHAANPAPSLIGTLWRAEEIDGRGVLERPESTLAFDDARRITGHTACNRYFGELEVGEGTLRLKPAGTTRMACAPVVMDQESRFLAALSAATAFRIDGGKLLLLDEAGRVRVRLAPHGPRREGSSPTPGQPAASSLPLAAHAFDRDNRSSFALVHIENAARWAKQST